MFKKFKNKFKSSLNSYEIKEVSKLYDIKFNDLNNILLTTIKDVVPLFEDNDKRLPCDFLYLFNLLSDNESKIKLCQIAEYYINRDLGIKTNYLKDPAEYSLEISKIKKIFENDLKTYSQESVIPLALVDLSPIGVDIKVFTNEVCLLVEYIYKQYEYADIVKVDEGDIVFDCGAFCGDMTAFFAHKVGESGKVYAFEGIPDNINLINKTMKNNKHLEDRVEIVDKFVGDTDKTFEITSNGPRSSSFFDYGESQKDVCQVSQVKIDDFVDSENIDKVDFIKFDIEGSELGALKGATKVIKKYKPRLAISVYHKPNEDLYEIPKFINELDLEYNFYLKYNMLDATEIVLFADCVNKE